MRSANKKGRRDHPQSASPLFIFIFLEVDPHAAREGAVVVFRAGLSGAAGPAVVEAEADEVDQRVFDAGAEMRSEVETGGVIGLVPSSGSLEDLFDFTSGSG